MSKTLEWNMKKEKGDRGKAKGDRGKKKERKRQRDGGDICLVGL